jgi:phospholipid-binding lipoprotein MlaA
MNKLLCILLLVACSVTVSAQESDPAATDTMPTPPVAAEEISEDDDLFLFDEADELDVSDPLETFNRGVFWFNDKLYFYLIKPVARGYRWAVPEPWRIAVQNVFSNLGTPVRFINAGLQGKFSDAGTELARFAINTTIGIGGLFDTAKDHFDLRKKDEDAGQTLGHYGVGMGFYLVLPVIGPSNPRDAVGLLVDSRMNLLYYISEGRTYWGLRAYDKINDLSIDKDTYEGIKKDALDPYLFVRDAFIQYRRNKVEN